MIPLYIHISDDSDIITGLIIPICIIVIIQGIMTLHSNHLDKKHRQQLFEDFGERPQEFKFSGCFTIFILEASRIISLNRKKFRFSEISNWHITRKKIRVARGVSKDGWQIKIEVTNPSVGKITYVSDKMDEIMRIQKILMDILAINKLPPIPTTQIDKGAYGRIIGNQI